MIITPDELILKLDIGQLDPENQQIVIDNIANTISTRTWLKVSEKLTENDLDIIEVLMAEDKEEEIENFIKSKLPNYDQFVSDTESEVIFEITSGLKAYKAETTKSSS